VPTLFYYILSTFQRPLGDLDLIIIGLGFIYRELGATLISSNTLTNYSIP